MSKKNSKEKRKQQAIRNAAAQEQEMNLVKKNPDYVKPETKKSKKNASEQVQVKMNFYSGMVMITTLFAAATFAVAMIISSNPNFYVMKARYGDSDVASFLVDQMAEMQLGGKYPLFCHIEMGLLLLVAIFALIGIMNSMNPQKKPILWTTIVMPILSGASLVLFFLGESQLEDARQQFAHVTGEKVFGLYNEYMILLIINTVALVINIFGYMYGKKKYQETGYTC